MERCGLPLLIPFLHFSLEQIKSCERGMIRPTVCFILRIFLRLLSHMISISTPAQDHNACDYVDHGDPVVISPRPAPESPRTSTLLPGPGLTVCPLLCWLLLCLAVGGRRLGKGVVGWRTSLAVLPTSPFIC